MLYGKYRLYLVIAACRSLTTVNKITITCLNLNSIINHFIQKTILKFLILITLVDQHLILGIVCIKILFLREGSGK